MTNLTNADLPPTRGILAYVGIAYMLSIALSLVVGVTGGYHSRFVFGLGLASMFVPTVAVLVVAVAMNENVRSFGWSRFPLTYLPAALLLMPIVMHAVMLPVGSALWGTLPWAEWLTPQADGLYHTPVSLGWGVLTAPELRRRIATNIVVGLIASSTFAFFEEVGWRAWMLPRLAVLMGARRAIVVSSIIWAFWHTPFALSGIHHLDGVPVRLTALTMPIGISGAGLVIGWLWVRTESIWIVALAHGALNNWGQLAFKFMGGPGTGQASDVVVLGAGGLALLAAGSLLLVYGCASPAGSLRRGTEAERNRNTIY